MDYKLFKYMVTQKVSSNTQCIKYHSNVKCIGLLLLNKPCETCDVQYHDIDKAIEACRLNIISLEHNIKHRD